MSTFDDQLKKIKSDPGFIAALDQSGGSTPKALKLYGVGEDAWTDEKGMYDVVHAMRTRIITSPAFSGKRLIGAILFENTMDRDIAGKPGDPVVAAAAGRVIYIGTGIRGYGKLIVIKHDANYNSVYAHNREILVKEGQNVVRGQRIAVGPLEAELGEQPLREVRLERRDGDPAVGSFEQAVEHVTAARDTSILQAVRWTSGNAAASAQPTPSGSGKERSNEPKRRSLRW